MDEVERDVVVIVIIWGVLGGIVTFFGYDSVRISVVGTTSGGFEGFGACVLGFWKFF